MPMIEIPCNLGDRVYRIQETKYNGNIKYLEYPIIHSVVTAVHFGRKMKFKNVSEKSESYIRLTSVVTGYMSKRIPFERFVKDCYYTYAEAEAEVKRRIGCGKGLPGVDGGGNQRNYAGGKKK